MLTIRNGTRAETAAYIHQHAKNIYLWGAGVLTQICISQWVLDYQLSDQVMLCTDSAPEKVGKKAVVGAGEIPIISREGFIEQVKQDRNSILILSCSYFKEILEYLDREKGLDGKECIIAPIMYLSEPALVSDRADDISDRKERIPRIIHYCWFGNHQMSDKSRRCIESWKRFCPDYQILCWNENTYDLEKSRWLRKAYENKQWAFVSDYARADILYQYGGLYFDVDVEIIKNLDNLLCLEAFGGFEKWPVLNTGGGCGSVPGFWLWKEIMDQKDRAAAENQGVLARPAASGYFDTLPLLKRGLKLDGGSQCIDGFNIFPSDYFHPFDYLTKQESRTEHTYSVHYFNWTWSNELMKNGNPGRESEDSYYELVKERIKTIG